MNFLKNNIKTPKDLLKYLSENMHYGFTYRNKVFSDNEEDFNDNMNKYYKLRLKENFVKNKYGVCWDFCEFERLFFEEMKIPHECYFYISFFSRSEGGPTHTFLLYEHNGKCYWFEYAWQKFRGIWEYKNKHEALVDILKKFSDNFNRKFENVEIYKIKKAKSRLNTYEFVNHCLSGEKIELN